MGNLGFYEKMTTLAKKFGGPKKLLAVVVVTSYAVLRPVEAAVKKGVKEVVRAMKKRSAPCATKGLVFRATSDGEASGVKIRVGDEYRVLECDGDAILIEVLGDPNNPYFVASKFLRSISDFPQDDAEGSE